MELSMMRVVLALACVTLALGASVQKRSVETEEEQRAYFYEYGYLFEGNSKLAALTDSDPKKAFTDAVKAFQHMAGLNVTGVVDAATRDMMGEKRCGVKDNVNMANIARRRKRYAAEGSRWGRNSLTWKITQYTSDLWTTQQRNELRRAFQVWADQTPLTFVETNGTPDIEIKFAAGEHGDGFTFDGKGRTLAHAFFPRFGGDAHFDDDEDFTMNTYSGTNLFQVAAHEFGHSLGLGHSDVRSSLMAPFYRGYQPNFKLDADDIQGIQYLYGQPSQATPSTPAPTTQRPTTRAPAGRSTTTPRTTTTTTSGPSPDYCMDGQFDAIAQYEGDTYAFRGDQVMKLQSSGIASGYPKKIAATTFRDLPSNLDAALHWPASSLGPARTYFFKGSQYWRYNSYGLASGYPRNIADGFRGLPNDIDAAFVWGGNGITYFIKGNQYYRYTRGSRINSGYPRALSLWRGLPSSIDAAFEWTNGRTYFFSGVNYYRFNDQAFEVDTSYPRLLSQWWLGCDPNALHQMTDEEEDEDNPLFVDIMPSSGPDDFDDVYSGQTHTTVTISLVLLSVMCHMFSL